jgi:hypothetical protein
MTHADLSFVTTRQRVEAQCLEHCYSRQLQVSKLHSKRSSNGAQVAVRLRRAFRVTETSPKASVGGSIHPWSNFLAMGGCRVDPTVSVTVGFRRELSGQRISRRERQEQIVLCIATTKQLRAPSPNWENQIGPLR